MAILTRYRHLSRYRQIARVLIRYGFGLAVEQLGLTDVVSYPSRLFRRRSAGERGLTRGERLRLVLEELGPTYVKLGQVASTRPDLVPPDILAEMEKLQDRVPPFPVDKAWKVIEEELGSPLEEIFAEFEAEPIASASIGQVYRARLHSGEWVAVKVLRPGIQKVVEADLEVIEDLAQLAQRRSPHAQMYNFPEMADEFARTIRDEMDYRVEARNVEQFGRIYRDSAEIKIPTVFKELTTRRVLTLEYVTGTKLTQVEKLRQAGVDLGRLARLLTRTMLAQVLDEGYFHADPHPGNLLLLEDGRLAFLDFGMIGRLTEERREQFIRLVIGLARRETRDIVRALSEMGMVGSGVDRQELEQDVERARDRYLDVPLSEIALSEAVNDILRLAFKHRIRIPSEFTLLARALGTLEGLVTQLDPDFSIIEVARPFGDRLIRERYVPERVLRVLYDNFLEYSDLLRQLPAKLGILLDKAAEDRIRIRYVWEDWDRTVSRAERMANRLTFALLFLSFSIMMASLVLASSVGQAPTLWNLPMLEIGFVVAALLFLGIFWAIVRSGFF